ncbi:MAG TPA: exodeoxyribonuclease VII small subunit [Burkholderiales bacterium]|nr:exodeoxyribonuclease VII small subunit [Burkholderiales bacterium]
MSKSPRQSSSAEVAPVSELTFERALAELERVVGQMEGGNLSLEQALAAHKRGLELARFCQQRLEAAQQQVKVLEGEVLKPLALEVPESGDGD